MGSKLKKVQKKNDEIENLANHLSKNNKKTTFFKAWKQYTDTKKYLREMEDRADKYYQNRVRKQVIKAWLAITMHNTKVKIKD